MKTAKWLILGLGGLASLLSCTSNPIGDREIPQPNLVIRGTVTLSNQDDPQNVYVWFDALRMSQRPDAVGNFEFTLPPPPAQTSSGGLDGAFNVHFFLANFNFLSKPVIIRNGSFLYNIADLDANGKLFPEAFLNEQLRIRTEIEPSTVKMAADSVSFSVAVNLLAFKDTVEVFFPRVVDEQSAPLLLRNMENESVKIVATTITSVDTTDFKKISTTLFTRDMAVQLSTADIAPGLYEVIPYLLVLNDAVPEELIASISDSVETLGPNYLKLPLIRREGQLEILEDLGDER